MRDIEVKLNAEERQYLEDYVKKGKHSARAIKRANVLLLLDGGESGKEIPKRARVSGGTVSNIKTRYEAAKGNIAKVIEEKPRPEQAPKITQEVEAHITSLACSKAPDGRSQRSAAAVELTFIGRDVELGYVGSLSHEAVRKCLKKVSRATVAQTVAKETPGRRAVVHRANRWRISGLPGRCAGPLSATRAGRNYSFMSG